MKKVAILISGRGSNMQALCQAAQNTKTAYEVCGIVSDHSQAAGLEWAHEHGFFAKAIERKEYANKIDFEKALHDQLKILNADYICLAGFMRLLSSAFVNRWQGKILNIHPSLLPSFKGLAPQKQALESGVRISGCTVHFVSAKMDDGPIIAQVAVPVLPMDSEHDLSQRILQAEHEIYERALTAVCLDKVIWNRDSSISIETNFSEQLHGFRAS